jgi:hypothetical protein
VNPIQQIAMFGTFGEVFLLEAFFAGTLNKVSNFEIIFEVIFFFGHGWRPFFARLDYLFKKPRYSTILANAFTARSGVG